MRTRGWSDGDVDLLRDFAASLDFERGMDYLRLVSSKAFVIIQSHLMNYSPNHSFYAFTKLL